MRAPSRAVARRRRLAFTYVPAFTVGALLCTAAGPSLNGGWALGSLLMLAAIGGVLLDLEQPKMTEQPAETVVLPTGPTAPATVSPIFLSYGARKALGLDDPSARPVVEPISEQEWLGNDTPQGGDPQFAQAFDAAHDSFDACGEALDNGELAQAKHHALNLIGRISRLQALSREA